MKKNILSFFVTTSLILFIIFAQSVQSNVQTAEQVAKKAFNSTVLLVMEDSNGQPTSLGSGFFVSKGIVATNLHVVEGASRGYARIVGKEYKYNIDGIVGIDSKRDLVLLKINTEYNSTLSLGNSNSSQVGETVYAVGNPQGLEGTFSQGIISSIKDLGSEKLIQLTAPISPGSSGGPVLNSNGNVIGISVATFRGGQNLNFAIPVNYLSTLLKNTTSLKSLSDLNTKKSKESIVAQLGDRSAEGVVGAQFTWDSYVDYRYTFPYDGEFTFSLRNKFRESVKNVFCLIIFYDSDNQPLDIDVIRYTGTIPGGLARRVSSETDGSVQKITTPQRSAQPNTKIEFRILDFDIEN
ncbi:MAG: trypsin-like peptidase domain-containing protein [Balneolaceae bacterium]|nr:trypsin-like peptidase domain-containing protein [Balneolaceae bacterium]